MRYRTWKLGRLIVGLGVVTPSNDHRATYEKVADWHNAGLPCYCQGQSRHHHNQPLRPDATLYVSHGAGGKITDGGYERWADCDWFIVEPRDNPGGQVKSLLRAGRTVYMLPVTPGEGRLLEAHPK